MHISDCWRTDYARQRTISEPVNINDEKFFVNFLIIVLMIIVYNGNSIDVESRIDIINEYFFLKIYLLHTNKSILDILNRALAAVCTFKAK